MGKVAVITGGGSGLGFACAKEIDKNGYIILITGRDIDKLKDAQNALNEVKIQSFIIKCDVSNEDDIKNLLKYAKSLGEICVLVNAAGVAPPKIKNEEKIIKINAIGTLLINELFYKEMENYGCIVNIGSVCAYEIPKFLRPKRIFSKYKNRERLFNKMVRLSRIFGKKHAFNIAYAISKCFVVYYSKIVSKRFYDDNKIRVLSISPSNFLTEMGKNDLKERPKEVKKYIDKQAIKRSGNPESLGYLVSCLIDPKIEQLTGTDIHMDGGWYDYNKGKVRW